MTPQEKLAAQLRAHASDCRKAADTATDAVLTSMQLSAIAESLDQAATILSEHGGGGEAAPFGWVFQHDETGRMAFCPNDGVNTPEVFAELNPRYTLCAPADTTPPTPSVPVVDDARCGSERYELDAYIWKRESTQEWVLEISGEVGGASFISRHSEPLTTPPEDVAGLPSLYAALSGVSAPVGVEERVRGIIALLRQPEPDNGEDHTDHDKGYEQASAEIADMLERILATAEQPGSVVQGEIEWLCNCCTTRFRAPSNPRPSCPHCKAHDQFTYTTPPPAPAATYATPDDVALTMGPDDIPHLLIAGAEVARFPKGSWAEVCEAFDFGGYRYEPPAPAAEQEDDVLRCRGCGKPYSEFPLDTHLPDDQFKAINDGSEGGVLCESCVLARGAERLHATVAHVRFDTPTQPDARGVEDSLLVLSNDISSVYGNTSHALAEHLWRLGYRKAATPNPVRAEQPEGKGAECSPGEPAPPPSTPAQHYLAAHNGCATQEWQDGFNTCASAPAAPVGVDELDASIIREAADLLTAVGDSGVQLPETWRWPLIDELHGIAALAGKTQEESK